jgi:hypothetical protein
MNLISLKTGFINDFQFQIITAIYTVFLEKMSSEKNFKNRGDGNYAGGTDWDWGLIKNPALQ